MKLTLLDPLGRGISGLKCHVSEGDNIFIRGVTNDQGEGRSFTSSIGTSLDVYVERFDSGGMKKIKTIVPNFKIFSVKLFSNKIKETVTLETAKGDPGAYRRKTKNPSAGDAGDSHDKKSGAIANGPAEIKGLGTGARPQEGQKVEAQATNLSAEDRKTLESRTVGSTVPIRPVIIEKTKDRGSNGTPKTTIAMNCIQNGCIKLGMSGLLIEEVNIRLTGFGGSVKSNTQIDIFTTDTESAIKKFQRDYMNVEPSGRICGNFLHALDEFRLRFQANVSSMKCPCGKCDGFGSARVNGESVKIYRNKKAIDGIEYPGVHRALLWLLRASLFYTSVNRSDLGFEFLTVVSGYRCWDNNKIHGRASTNHMGNALDLHFKRGKNGLRCEGKDLETLRDEIFVACLGANRGWKVPYSAALENASDGAKSWVHVDVREFCEKFKEKRFYATSQEGGDGESMINLARRLGLFGLVNCGGIPVRP